MTTSVCVYSLVVLISRVQNYESMTTLVCTLERCVD